jgi:hypothetical protein
MLEICLKLFTLLKLIAIHISLYFPLRLARLIARSYIFLRGRIHSMSRIYQSSFRKYLKMRMIRNTLQEYFTLIN